MKSVTAWPYRHVCLDCEVAWSTQTVRPSPCPWCQQLAPHAANAMQLLNRLIGTRGGLEIGETGWPIRWPADETTQ